MSQRLPQGCGTNLFSGRKFHNDYQPQYRGFEHSPSTEHLTLLTLTKTIEKLSSGLRLTVLVTMLQVWQFPKKCADKSAVWIWLLVTLKMVSLLIQTAEGAIERNTLHPATYA